MNEFKPQLTIDELKRASLFECIEQAKEFIENNPTVDSLVVFVSDHEKIDIQMAGSPVKIVRLLMHAGPHAIRKALEP